VAFLDHLPPLLGGLGLAALMAAIMSTASTLFVLAGFGLSRDLYENLLNEEISEKQRMRVSRIAQVLVGVVVAAVAIAQPAAIYWILVYAGAIFGVGWLPTVVAGLEWKRMNGRAALASMLVGVGSYIGITELVSSNMVSLPMSLDPLMVSFGASVASLIVVALRTQPTEYERQSFARVRNASASASTIQAVLARPHGLADLRREVRSVYTIAAVFLSLAVLIWEYLFVNLGL